MKNTVISFALLFFVISCSTDRKPGCCDSFKPGNPESAGMSAAKLARIDTMLTESIRENKIPGAVALVARKGRIVYCRAFGKADSAGIRQYKTDDIFRIASQTKAVTATAVMILWERGKFQLDDPISRYIPEFRNPTVLTGFNPADSGYTSVPAQTEITVRQLLTHTSGIGYGMIDGDPAFKAIYSKAGIVDAWTTKEISIGENIKKLARLPLHHKPGENFTYSEGLDVLGYFIEVISGQKFDEFMKKEIFDPLKMEDTWFYLPGNKANRLVPALQKKDGVWGNFRNEYFDVDYPLKGAKTYFAGGAGLSSTAYDYARFLQMYLNEGELEGKRILSRSTVHLILSNQIGKIWGEDSPTKYGLAFELVTKKGQEKGGIGSEGTFSWGGYYDTQYYADPKEQTVGILMKQVTGVDNDDTWMKFRILLSAAIDD